MAKFTYYTEEGLERIKKELHHLKTVERAKAAEAIAEARDKGDLSENAEYDSAKEEQGLLENRIADLEQKMATAKPLDKSTIDTSKVSLLSTVTIVNMKSKAKVTYSIVPTEEANLKENKISVETPIAKGLLGKKVGDMAEVKTPGGQLQFKIEKITT